MIEMPEGRAKELYVPAGQSFFRLGEIEEHYKALGTTLQKAIEDFSKSMSGILTGEIQKAMQEVVSSVNEATTKMLENLRKSLGEGAKTLGEAGRKITKDFDSISEEGIKKAIERFNRFEENARKLKKAYDDLLPRLETDADLRKALIYQNFTLTQDPTTGNVLADVGGKKIPVDQISTEQIKQMALQGYLTSAPTASQTLNKLQSTVNLVGGIVQGVMAPSMEAVGTIAPTPLEQMQIGGGVAGGIFGGIAATGLATGNIPVAAVGLIGGLITQTFIPLFQALEKRRIEIEQREAKLSWGMTGAGAETEAMYRGTANVFYPIISKQQIEELMKALADMGSTIDNLRDRTLAGAGAMASFGLSVQDVTRLQTMYVEQMRLAPESVSGMLGAAYAGAGLGPTTFGAGERVGLAEQIAGIGYQIGIGMPGDESVMETINTLTSTFAGLGIPPDELQQLLGNFLSPIGMRMAIYGSTDLSGLSKEQLVNRTIVGLRRYGLLNPDILTNPLKAELVAKRLGVTATAAKNMAKVLQNPDRFSRAILAETEVTEKAGYATKIASWWMERKPGNKSWRETSADYANRWTEFVESIPEEELRAMVTFPDEILNTMDKPTADFIHALRRALVWKQSGQEGSLPGYVYESRFGELWPKVLEERGWEMQEISEGYEEAKRLREEMEDLFGKTTTAMQTGSSVTVGTGTNTVIIKLADGATSNLFELVTSESAKNARGKGESKAGE